MKLLTFFLIIVTQMSFGQYLDINKVFRVNFEINEYLKKHSEFVKNNDIKSITVITPPKPLSYGNNVESFGYDKDGYPEIMYGWDDVFSYNRAKNITQIKGRFEEINFEYKKDTLASIHFPTSGNLYMCIHDKPVRRLMGNRFKLLYNHNNNGNSIAIEHEGGEDTIHIEYFINRKGELFAKEYYFFNKLMKKEIFENGNLIQMNIFGPKSFYEPNKTIYYKLSNIYDENGRLISDVMISNADRGSSLKTITAKYHYNKAGEISLIEYKDYKDVYYYDEMGLLRGIRGIAGESKYFTKHFTSVKYEFNYPSTYYFKNNWQTMHRDYEYLIEDYPLNKIKELKEKVDYLKSFSNAPMVNNKKEKIYFNGLLCKIIQLKPFERQFYFWQDELILCEVPYKDGKFTRYYLNKKNLYHVYSNVENLEIDTTVAAEISNEFIETIKNIKEANKENTTEFKILNEKPYLKPFNRHHEYGIIIWKSRVNEVEELTLTNTAFKIEEFTMGLVKPGFTYELKSASGKFTEQMKSDLKEAAKNNYPTYINRIKCKTAEGRVFYLQNLDVKFK